METKAKNLSIKTNVYLKLISKTIKPNKDFVNKFTEQEIEKEYAEKALKGEEVIEYTEEQKLIIREKVEKDNTYYKYMLVKIKPSKLLTFIQNNGFNIKKIETDILLNQKVLTEILKDYNIESIDVLPIYMDSDTILCTIYGVTKEMLDKSLENKDITQEQYDVRIKMLEL
jgi:hypothetical protein